MYRIGFPGWRFAACFGVLLLLKIEVNHDVTAGVFVATSPDLKGLVVEATDLDLLMRDISICARLLLTEQLKCGIATKFVAAWDGELRTNYTMRI